MVPCDVAGARSPTRLCPTGTLSKDTDWSARSSVSRARGMAVRDNSSSLHVGVLSILRRAKSLLMLGFRGLYKNSGA